MPVMESAVQHQELIGSWFWVEFDNKAGSRFTEVSGLSVEVASVDLTITTPKGDAFTRKLPGITSYGELGLKRVLSADKSMYEWTKKIRDGAKDFRTNGSITLVDISGDPQAKWTFMNAWPSKWSVSDMSAGAADPMIEDITIQIELLKREK